MYSLFIIILVNCPPGSQGVTGSTCTRCTIDTFQDQQGRATCRPCPSGQGTISTGAVECTGESNCTSVMLAAVIHTCLTTQRSVIISNYVCTCRCLCSWFIFYHWTVTVYTMPSQHLPVITGKYTVYGLSSRHCCS